MSWKTLQDHAADLATFGSRRLASPGVAYLATVDGAGSPRIHPVTPILAPGHLFVFMEPSSPKGRDLDRGSRYALHCAVEDQDGGAGEFRVAGTARRIDDQRLRDLATTYAPYTPSDRYVLFELLVDHAFSTVYADDGTPLRERWHGGV
jgi:hypothetical protein